MSYKVSNISKSNYTSMAVRLPAGCTDVVVSAEVYAYLKSTFGNLGMFTFSELKVVPEAKPKRKRKETKE